MNFTGCCTDYKKYWCSRKWDPQDWKKLKPKEIIEHCVCCRWGGKSYRKSKVIVGHRSGRFIS